MMGMLDEPLVSQALSLEEISEFINCSASHIQSACKSSGKLVKLRILGSCPGYDKSSSLGTSALKHVLEQAPYVLLGERVLRSL